MHYNSKLGVFHFNFLQFPLLYNSKFPTRGESLDFKTKFPARAESLDFNAWTVVAFSVVLVFVLVTNSNRDSGFWPSLRLESGI